MKTTTGAIDEASELFDLIEKHERVTASMAKVAVADSRYGNTAKLIALAQRKICAHVADLRKSAGVSERSLSRLIEIVTEGIAVCDNEGRITLINSRAERLFGYGRGELRRNRLKYFC